jgi:hypothetical protein
MKWNKSLFYSLKTHLYYNYYILFIVTAHLNLIKIIFKYNMNYIISPTGL